MNHEHEYVLEEDTEDEDKDESILHDFDALGFQLDNVRGGGGDDEDYQDALIWDARTNEALVGYWELQELSRILPCQLWYCYRPDCVILARIVCDRIWSYLKPWLSWHVCDCKFPLYPFLSQPQQRPQQRQQRRRLQQKQKQQKQPRQAQQHRRCHPYPPHHLNLKHHNNNHIIHRDSVIL